MNNISRKALWEERVAQWRASGQSQRAFALQRGFPVSQMGYWVRRLGRKPAAALLPVSVKPALTAAPGLTLRSPGGWSVALPAGTSAAWLADLLRAL